MSIDRDLTQPRITFVGDTAWGDMCDAFDHIEQELNDGAHFALIKATHVAEFAVLWTEIGPRYIVGLKELSEMTHYPDDVSETPSEWLTVDVFTEMSEAKAFYVKLITDGVDAWMNTFDKTAYQR